MVSRGDDAPTSADPGRVANQRRQIDTDQMAAYTSAE